MVKTAVGVATCLILAAALSTQVGCATVDIPIEGLSSSATSHSYRFHADTGNDRYGHNAEDGATSTVFRLDLLLTDGKAHVSVLDPGGTVLWQEVFSGRSEIEKEQSFKATPGWWFVEVALEEAAGHYRVSMLDH